MKELTKDQLKPEHPDRKTGYERILTDPPAPWFVELYPGGEGRGFVQKLERYSAIFHDRTSARLIVSFDNLANANDLSFAREPWAWKFIRDSGWSHLGVLSREKTWYRDREIIDYMEGLATEGFFKRFDEVVLIGTSMGGFAALVFSTLIKNARVVVFNPQSTLDEKLVPWEKRYRFGRNQDWTLPYSDGVAGVAHAAKTYVIYDHFFEPDRRHAERLAGPKTTLLKAWYSNHFSAVMLRKLGLLKDVMTETIDATMEPDAFYRLFRARKALPWYMRGLTEHAGERHAQLVEQGRRRFRAIRRQSKVEASAAAEDASGSDEP